MKVIIPIAGHGTRLLPHTKYLQKCLLPVAGKPVIDHILEPLIKQGINDIILITGHLENQVKKYVTKFDAKFKFVRQPEALGLGHAVNLGLENSEEPVLIQLGDVIYDINFSEFCQSETHTIAVDIVPDPERFGIVEVEKDKILRVLEKPKNPPSNLAIIGLYYIKKQRSLLKSLQFLVENNITTNNEIQLADAFQRMIDSGEKIVHRRIASWYDCGIPDTFLSTNSALLVRSGKILDGSTIIEPVAIGKNCHITNSTIGPNVTVMSGAIIKDSLIKDSIVLWNARVIHRTIDHTIIEEGRL